MNLGSAATECDRLRWILKIAGHGGGDDFEPVDVRKEQGSLYLWPSGIEGIDDDPRIGGFYGCTAITGFPKLGKSMLVLYSAVQAARAGWEVLYYDAELSQKVLAGRMRRVLRATPENWPDWVMDRMVFRALGKLATVEKIGDDASNRLQEEFERHLIIIDSVNRLAKRRRKVDAIEEELREDKTQKRWVRSPGGYFEHLQDVVDWAAECTKKSLGRLGFMLVSELNRKGQATGQDIEYAASCILDIRKGGAPHRVELEFRSRETPPADLGEYIRLAHEGRFVKPGFSVVRNEIEDEEPVEEAPPVADLPF